MAGADRAGLSLSSNVLGLSEQRMDERAGFLKPLLGAAGEGRHTFLDGSYYEGSWVAGERSAGVFVSGDRSWEYRGQWRGPERHGQGTLFQKGLSKYTGKLYGNSGACSEERACTQCMARTKHRRHWKACMGLSTGYPLPLRTPAL